LFIMSGSNKDLALDEVLKAISPQSHVLPLNDQEQQCLITHFDSFVMSDHGLEEIPNVNDPIIVALRKRIQECIEKNENQPEGYLTVPFPSAIKDYVLDFPSMISIKQKMLQELERLSKSTWYQNGKRLPLEDDEDDDSFPDTNGILMAFFKAAVDAGRVSSAEEILVAMLNSTKINAVILKHRSRNESDPLHSATPQLHMKPWSDLPLGSYFRGVVGKNRKLNFVSQYYNFLYFPDMLPYKQEIQTTLEKYFTAHLEHQLRDEFLPCAIDFVVKYPNLNTLEENPVIEACAVNISPFEEESPEDYLCMESILWEEKRNQILSGPYEFYVEEQPVAKEFLVNYITPNLESFMDDVLYEFSTGGPRPPRSVTQNYANQYCTIL